MTARRCITPPSGRAASAAAAYRAVLPVLETARLRLRATHLGDYAAFEAVMMADTGHMGGPFSGDQAWHDFGNYIAGWLLHGHGGWTVERKSDGAIVGFVLVGLEWEDDEPEIGWMLVEEHRGQGYATEAAQAARDFGVDLLGAGACVSYIDRDNAASIRVAERLGAVRDETAEAPHGDDLQVWRHGVAA